LPGAVIATSLVLVAVFVPVGFPGHYRIFVPGNLRSPLRFRGDFRVQRFDPDSGALRDFSWDTNRERAQGKFFRLFKKLSTPVRNSTEIACGER